jgi:hypothetical protein
MSPMCRWNCPFIIIVFYGIISANCSSRCDCPSATADLVDYTRATENEQFKVCFSSDSAARKDGVFYYTTPSAYDIYDCSGRGNIKVNNPTLDSGYNTMVFVDNGALFVNHHKSRSFNKKYCQVDSKFLCAFWITYNETYYQNGTVDSTHELRYPKLSPLTIKSYLDKFAIALAKAKKEKNFEEDPGRMEGFDYYGHAENLLIAALNGDAESEEKFRNYRSLTKDIVSRKIYSVYSEEFDVAADRDFFFDGNDILDEANEYKLKYGNN